jgi:hypothetical protein
LIVCGDLHLKNKEPFVSATENFFEWIDKKYPNDELVLLGDIFDTSSPQWEIFSLFAEFVRSRNSYVYILEGNHTYSKIKGSVLEGLGNVSNVKQYLIPNTIGLDMLCLPFLTIDNKKYYENEFNFIPNDFDFIFTHLSPKECSWGNEGIDFDKVNLRGTYIHGHIHMQSEFKDIHENRHIVLGVPFPTRHGEHLQEHRIARITNKEIEFIKVPQFFIYETIEFGQEPSSSNNILNIKNATSWEIVYEKYKKYYIREEGVEFVKKEGNLEFEQKEFEGSSLKQKFKIFQLDRRLPKEVSEKCFDYIDKYENLTEEK